MRQAHLVVLYETPYNITEITFGFYFYSFFFSFLGHLHSSDFDQTILYRRQFYTANTRHQHQAWRCWGHSSAIRRASLLPDPLAGEWLEGICCVRRGCSFCHFHSILHKFPGKGKTTSKEEEQYKGILLRSVSQGAKKYMCIIFHYACRKKGSLGEK